MVVNDELTAELKDCQYLKHHFRLICLLTLPAIGSAVSPALELEKGDTEMPCAATARMKTVDKAISCRQPLKCDFGSRSSMDDSC